MSKVITSAAAANSYIFTIYAPGTGTSDVTLKDMTIRYGNSTQPGCGISNYEETLTLTNCTISGNLTSNSGGGIYNKNGSLTMNNCTVSENTVSGSLDGGGIYNYNSGILIMTNCTVSGNSTGSDGSGGGIYQYSGTGRTTTITMTNCTVSGNESGYAGGGIHSDNYGTAATITMTNCTVSGNEAPDEWSYGGGIYNYQGATTLTNCTISGNKASGTGAGTGGGGYYLDNGTLNIKNTIIANNTGQNGSTDDYHYSSGTLTDNGYNIVEITNVGAGSGGFTNTTNNDIVGEQANLNLRSTLADNGTLNGTQTLALYYNGITASVAIDAGGDATTGTNNGVAVPSTDQRGAERYDFTSEPDVQSSTDIGAYEDWPGGDTTLPVTLSSFTAQFIENTPTLYWTTQSETDNMGWFVYRSAANDFTTSEKISEFIEGHGTTTQQQSYIYEDNIENPEVGDTYYYWLESIDYSGIVNHYDKVAVLTIPDQHDPGGLIPEPERYGLLQNEPNPVITSTKISFNLHKTAQVELNIYNLKGQLVKSLYSGVASSKTLNWNGKDNSGKELTPGIYLYKLLINGKTAETKKLILMN